MPKTLNPGTVGDYFLRRTGRQFGWSTTWTAFHHLVTQGANKASGTLTFGAITGVWIATVLTDELCAADICNIYFCNLINCS